MLTLLLVQRTHINTVTARLPILMPCPERQEGFATFLTEFATPVPVRVVTEEDFKPKARGMSKALSEMWEEEREQFKAVLGLLTGLQQDDELAISRARTHVRNALALKREGDKKLGIAPAREDDLDFGRTLIHVFGLQPAQEKEAIQRWCGYQRGPRAETNNEWLLSQLMSEALNSVRLVLWWSGNQFQPALYCPHAKSAVYTFLLMKIVAGRGWGVCPYCGEFFIQNRSDQSYCTITHREAHRVGRWRAAKLSQSKKKGGGPSGSRKAR